MVKGTKLRRLFLAVANGTRLHVSIERDGQDSRFYYPTVASMRRLEQLIKKLNCPPFISLSQERIGLIYEASRIQIGRKRTSMGLFPGKGGRA